MVSVINYNYYYNYKFLHFFIILVNLNNCKDNCSLQTDVVVLNLKVSFA